MLAASWIGDATAPQLDVGGIAVVVAHPDDETIGCGALLTRLPRAQVVIVTNGSPADPRIALQKGFSTSRSYAVARANELRAALKIAGVDGHRLHALDFVDGNVWRDWQSIVLRLTEFFVKNRITMVLTHAYEGGHSDHDGVAHCVHAAAELLGRAVPTIIEMPYYHATPRGVVHQRFCDGGSGIIYRLSQVQARLKRQMFLAYASQRSALAHFDPEEERFRIARRPLLGALPNNGVLRYQGRRKEFAATICKGVPAALNAMRRSLDAGTTADGPNQSGQGPGLLRHADRGVPHPAMNA